MTDEELLREALEALREAVEHAERWHEEGQAGEGRRCTSCVEFQSHPRAAITKLEQRLLRE
ncbi:hypothetical protein LCGC14_2007640 [marine sediment metagenome]|uniref:Uncharacterized protein n=1 Tax=marine sediment metagenome TaxID=412755 RepID=A0A0F9HEK6_9ZZZZ